MEEQAPPAKVQLNNKTRRGLKTILEEWSLDSIIQQSIAFRTSKECPPHRRMTKFKAQELEWARLYLRQEVAKLDNRAQAVGDPGPDGAPEGRQADTDQVPPGVGPEGAGAGGRTDGAAAS